MVWGGAWSGGESRVGFVRIVFKRVVCSSVCGGVWYVSKGIACWGVRVIIGRCGKTALSIG